MTQPTALRLADELDRGQYDAKMARTMDQAAAELRRLHEVETLYHAAMRGRHAMSDEVLKLTAQRDALLDALRTLLSYANSLEMRTDADGEHRAMQKARAAIAAVEDKT